MKRLREILVCPDFLCLLAGAPLEETFFLPLEYSTSTACATVVQLVMKKSDM